MHIPGFSRPEREPIAAPDTGQVYVERRPGESPEDFEARLAAAARERREVRETAAGEPRVVHEVPAREAYKAGRRDQHRAETRGGRRRHGFGMAGLIIVVVAALGVLWLALAAREGSFAAGGAVVDQKLAEAAEPARVAISQAADRTGTAVQTAGQKLEAQGERLREQAR
jgi:hypothetical protein